MEITLTLEMIVVLAILGVTVLLFYRSLSN